jgi:hypothetical protein
LDVPDDGALVARNKDDARIRGNALQILISIMYIVSVGVNREEHA